MRWSQQSTNVFPIKTSIGFCLLMRIFSNIQKRNDEKGPPRKIDMALLNSIPKRHLERESVDRVGSAATKGFRQSQPGSYRFKNPVNFMMRVSPFSLLGDI